MSFNSNLVPILRLFVPAFALILLIEPVFTSAVSLDDPATAKIESAGHSLPPAVGNYSNAQEPAVCPAIQPTNPDQCGGGPCVVDIKDSANAVDNREPFNTLKVALRRPNTTVRIGPNVKLDFNGLGDNYFPLFIARCVTLVSVDSFEATGASPIIRRSTSATTVNQPSIKQTQATNKARPAQRRSRRNVAQPRRSRANIARRGSSRGARSSTNSNVARVGGGNVGPINNLEVEPERRVGSGRTPRSSGPIFQFGSSHPKVDHEVKVFFELRCDENYNSDGARISGFQLLGKSFGQQSSSEIGIQNFACVNVEISNMEIAGWGEAAIKIVDSDPELSIPEGCVKLPSTGHPRPVSQAYACPPGKEATRPIPGPGGRISRPDQVRIFNNYLHHNQHPREGVFDGHAAGYGVDVNYGSWAQITNNLFDHNRHAIAASGDSGGYVARHNLVLKGGGIQFGSYATHQFDYHGNQNCGIRGFFSDSAWNCGNAGFEVVYDSNAFQYSKDQAIKIRGKMRTRGYIGNNIFPHDHLKGDAVDLFSENKH